MKKNLLWYLLMSLAVNFVYPVTSWAYINEIPSLGDDRKEEILLVMQKADERTRSVIVPPLFCYVVGILIDFYFSFSIRGRGNSPL